MFDSIIDKVFQQVQSQFESDRTHFSYWELTEKMPDVFVQKMLRERYEAIFENEKQRIATAPSHAAIGYEVPEIKKILDRLIDELKKKFLIAKEDIERLLRDTLLNRLQYLVMPLSTIETIVFHDAGARAVVDIAAKMRAFEKYRYYPDAIEKYASAKSITHLTKGQLRLLITEINQSLFGKDSLDNVLKVCGLIMKEVNDMQGRSTNTIEIELLMKAFADRSLHDFEVALNIEKELGNELINLYGLRQVLNRFSILKNKHTVPEGSAVKKGVSDEKRDTTKAVVESVKEEESGEVIDINQVIAASRKKEDTGSHARQLLEKGAGVTDRSVTLSDKDFNPAEVTNQFIREEMVEKFSEDTSSIKLSALKESGTLVLMETLISEEDHQMFLKKIFKNAPEDYDNCLHAINRAKTWKEAISILDDELDKYKADPFSKEAIRLSDLVYRRYYPPDVN